MKIAHIITGLEADGAETMLYKLLRSMDRRFDPVVVSLVDGGPIAARIEELGIPVFGCGMRPGFLSLPAAARLGRLLRRVRPDLLQGWMYHGNLAAQVASITLPGPTPVLWNIRGSHCNLRDEKFMTAATIWVGARLSGFPSKIISNSLASAKQHERLLRYRNDRWVIIPNGFEVDKFTPSESARADVRAELCIAPGTLLIGLIGRYHPMKDHANFLSAAAMLRTRLPDAQFLLAGAGVDARNSALRDQMQALGLLDGVHLLGARTDAPRITAALDIAGSASYSEAFPNVIGEAMSCGVPCVVTDVGDAALLVADTGCVVPPRDANALARAWLDLAELSPPERRALGAAARARIAAHFSMAAIAGRYEELYDEVRSGKSPAKGVRQCAA